MHIKTENMKKDLFKGILFSLLLSLCISYKIQAQLIPTQCGCTGWLSDAKSSNERGISNFHDTKLSEYAKKNKMIIIIRNNVPNLVEYIPGVYHEPATHSIVPASLYIASLDSKGFYDLSKQSTCHQNKGLLSLHPENNLAKVSIDRDMEYENKYEILSKRYSYYLFNVLLPANCYVYPIPLFEKERWYETYIDVLIEKNIQRQWIISNAEPDCYIIKDSLGRKIINDYRLMGIYNWDNNKSSAKEVQNLDTKLDEINNELNEAYGFDNTISTSKVKFIQKAPHDYDKDRNSWIIRGAEMGPWTDLTIYNLDGKVYQINYGDINTLKKFYECIKVNWETLYPSEIYDQDKSGTQANSTNVNGFPSLHKSQNYDGIGRPTSEQANYWNADNSPGIYNYKGYMKSKLYEKNNCLALLDKYKVNNHSDDAIKKLGIYPYHYWRLSSLSSDFNLFVGIRNSNPDAVQWIEKMYQGGPYRPKPFKIKGKSVVSSMYKNLSLPGSENSENDGLVGDCGNEKSRILGPGKVSLKDKICLACDWSCENMGGGLASYDPRTGRGRDLIDPEQKYTNCSGIDGCHSCFEKKYAKGLQKKC